MKTEPKLGQLAPDAQRDAVHVAVIPVVATVKVHPGQRVNAAGVPSDKPVGIVDPYLETAVLPGERYFLCLFPGTVTSLRHVWTHPSFEDVLKSERGEDSTRAASEKWLREYAARRRRADRSPRVPRDARGGFLEPGRPSVDDIWTAVADQLPPESVVVLTKIDDEFGVRNEQPLKRNGLLWFFADGSMYVYYAPTHWKPME